MDDSLHDPALVHTLGPDGVQAGNEGRWRKFGLTLLHGTFERLSLQNLAYHDIIVSAEVIEHLDPGPLANFGSTLLGKLKPKVCIVTTPNRDFNDLFTLPFTPASDTPLDSPGKEVSEPVIALGEIVDPNQLAPATPSKLPVPDPHKNLWDSLAPGDVCSSGDRYWRAGVPYGMRHPDHRFEWSRQEFRQWASNVAEEFGYDVTFTGVGGLGNGMYVIGSTGWAVGEALAKGCGYSHDDSQASESPNQGVLTKANEVWGDCTQIAVFTVREDIADDLAELVEVEDWSRKQANVDNSVANSPLNPYFFPNPITQVVHHNFPYSTDEEFPPSFLTIMELLEKELASYLPTRILEQWNKSASEYSQSQTFQRSKPEGSDSDNEYLFESDSECDYNWNPEIDGDENARKARRKERRYEKKTRRQVENAVLGDRRAEFIKVVKVMGVDLKNALGGEYGWEKRSAEALPLSGVCV
ncbi:hypothetical protein BDZ91DRAFT_789626 [Kalaharituber pfeilii]|nr:hypothetical protein BDZ91DRAFT_789626 [Kalaharituber pfeilii]